MWEIIVGGIWLLAIVYCLIEMYRTPISHPDDTNGYPVDNNESTIFIKKKDTNGSNDEKPQKKKGFYQVSHKELNRQQALYNKSKNKK